MTSDVDEIKVGRIMRKFMHNVSNEEINTAFLTASKSEAQQFISFSKTDGKGEIYFGEE